MLLSCVYSRAGGSTVDARPAKMFAMELCNVAGVRFRAQPMRDSTEQPLMG